MPVGGIIPARAGFTQQDRHPRLRLRDHPRSRGVYHPLEDEDRDEPGSSPLARGLHYVLTWEGLRRRIIPARAGFTRSGSPRGAPAGDHPRSRGVYACGTSTWTCRRGSSPLARGLRSVDGGDTWEERIIPARAGFTAATRGRAWRLRDHPRSRGVYHQYRRLGRGSQGSSPLARGLPAPSTRRP